MAYVPFGNIIDEIRNGADDDFEDSFDETYGDPNNINSIEDTKITMAFYFIVGTCIVLLLMVMIPYGWVWFIEDKRILSLWSPSWFPRTASEGRPQDAQGRLYNNNANANANANANVIDEATAANSSINSVGSGSEERGTELHEVSNSAYAKRLVIILTEEQKRSLFESVLTSRSAAEVDIMEERMEPLHHPPVADGDCTCDGNDNDNNTDENTTTTTAASIVIPDGSPSSTTTPDGNNTACCPICIQDIQVGERVCHSKRKNCKHDFHLDCMLEWLGTGSTVCPYCRREIFTKAMLEKAYWKQQRQEQKQKNPKKHRGV
jgi:hypothetical protein